MSTQPMDEGVPVDVEIGERVHGAMWKARVSQVTLAQVLHLDQAAISRRLRGRTAWKVSELIATAGVLGVPLSDLLPASTRALSAPLPLSREDGQASFRCTRASGKGTGPAVMRATLVDNQVIAA